MEETSTVKTSSNPPTGRFMDIARPGNKPVEPAPPAPLVPPETAAEPVAVPVAETQAAAPAPVAVEVPAEAQEQPAEVSVETVPVEEPAVEAEPNEATPETEQTPAPNDAQLASVHEPIVQPDEIHQPAAALSDKAPEQPEQPQLPPKTPHKAPIIAIFAAMFICLGLTGLIVFTFIKSKNETKLGGETTSSNSKTTVAKPQASPDDVDQASETIDQTLSSLDDTADFSASVLSDEALGL